MLLERGLGACKRAAALLCAAVLACGLCLGPCAAAQASQLDRYAKLEARYISCPEGGIAFFGSSYLSRWDSAARDFERAFGYPANMVYNYAIGGSGISVWTSAEYLDLVASKRPSVVVIHGVNDLRYYPDRPDSLTDEQAVEKSLAALKLYVAGLQERLPGVKIVLVSAFKTPAEYLHEPVYGSSCRSWQRIDLYNAKLRAFAAGSRQLAFVDIEPYLLGEDRDLWGNRRVRFYTNAARLCDKRSLASARTLQYCKRRGTLACPYFRSDLHHASKLAYSSIWLPLVGAVAVSSSAALPSQEI
ncbi:MAG: SGNH/GDSL hydrolase family protein [Coriobacteriales bacterium]